MAAPPTTTLQPPAIEQPLDDLGNHTQAWAAFHQDVSDEIAKLAKMRQGVTDGSDATAGDIGEFLQTIVPGPGASASSGATVNAATVDLTAGDWDVRGEVWIAATGTPTALAAGIGLASGTLPSLAPSSALVTELWTHAGATTHRLGPAGCRVSLSAGATVYLTAYTIGSAATCYGRIEARRAR